MSSIVDTVCGIDSHLLESAYGDLMKLADFLLAEVEREASSSPERPRPSSRMKSQGSLRDFTDLEAVIKAKGRTPQSALGIQPSDVIAGVADRFCVAEC